ncbi:MAG: DoxX family protein [Parachlamydiaceae bacterium]|nr:DoxX family protein [Parachlamydiaceae bacterium]
MIEAIKRIYGNVARAGETLQSFILLALRLLWGYSWFLAGSTKLNDPQTVANFFENMNIPFSLFSAYLVGYVEMIGGACLIIGFASRLVSIPLAITMIVALVVAHPDALTAAWNDVSPLLVQGAFVHLCVALIIFAFGPGKFSVDYIIQRLFSKGGKSK